MKNEEAVLISTWEELAEVADSAAYTLKIEDGCGWILDKASGQFEVYLSTHAFYELDFKHSSKTLQKHGFNVKLKSWG